MTSAAPTGSADPILLRIMLSADDFKRALDFARAARGYPDSTVEHEALLHSAILFYARPFSNNEEPWRKDLPNEARKLTGLDLTAILGPDKEFHDRLVNLRNKVVAHAEAEFFPAQNIPLTIGDKGQSGIAFMRQSWHVINEKLDLDVFERVAQAMNRAASLHVFDTARKIGLIQLGPFEQK